MREEPVGYLRALSREFASFVSKAPASLLPKSSQLQAVANAFVMLDIIAYDAAEAVLAEHRAALEGLGIELAGVKSGELTLRPTTAHGLAQARPRPN